MLTVEALHERWPFRPLSSYVIFFPNTLNFIYIFRNAIKNEKKFWFLDISVFELVAVNCPDSKKNACNRQSKC